MSAAVAMLNHWGESFLGLAWAMLWQSSLLAVLIFLADFALRHRVRAAVRHGLWLVLLVKLLLPPSLALPTSPVWWWSRRAPEVVRVAVQEKPPANYVVTENDLAPSAAMPAVMTTPPLPRPALNLAAGVLLAAGLGSLALLVWLGWRYWQVLRIGRLADGAPELELALAEARRLGTAALRPRVRVKISRDTMSPAVCGLFRPVILLPQALAETLSPGQMRTVLLHEVAHVRRGDVWVNFAQGLLTIVYWWHPLVWLANARIRRVREEAVDDAVMLALRDDAEVYAPTLLAVARFALRRPLASLGLVGILESRSALRQRIERLVNWPAPSRAGLSIVSGFGLFLFSAVALPMGDAPPLPTPTVAQAASAGQTTGVPTKVATETLLNVALQHEPTNAEANYYPDLITKARSEREKGVTNAPPQIRPMPIPAVEAPTTRLLKTFLLTADTGLPRFRHETGLAAASSSDDYLGAFAKMLAADGAILPTNSLWLGDQGFLLVRGTPVELAPVENLVLNLNGFSPHQAGSQSTTQTVVPTAVADTNLFMRTFKANGDVFYVSVQRASGLIPPPERNELGGVLRDLFERLGVDLSPPKAVFFNDRLGLLFVKGSGTDLEVVERVMESLNQPPQANAEGENPNEPAANATAGGAPPTRAPKMAANVPAKLVYTGPGRHEIVRKLDAIRLDVAYDDLPLSEVFRNLSVQTRKLDPEHSGINFLINPNTDTADSSPAPGTVDLGATLVNLTLENVRLADVLDAIVLVADHPLQYSIQDFGIVFYAKPAGDSLARTYRADPGTFSQGLEGVGSKSFGASANAGGASDSGASPGGGTVVPMVNVAPTAARTEFEPVFTNVSPNPGPSAATNPGILSNPNFEVASHAVQKRPGVGNLSEPEVTTVIGREANMMSGPNKITFPVPAQLHIKARFIEVSGDLEDIPAIINHWEGQTLVGIQSAEQADAFLRQLESRPGTTNLAEPEATTTSRRHTIMRATRILSVITGLDVVDQPGGQSSTMQTKSLEVGPVFDVVPIVEEDGRTIDLKAAATLTEFAGYDGPSNSTTVFIKTPGNFPTPPPVVIKRQCTFNLNVYDGQTLVLYDGQPLVEIPARDSRTGQTIPQAAGPPKHLLVLVTAALVDAAGNRVHSDDEIPFAGDHVPPKQEYQGAPLSDWPFDIVY